MKTRRHLASKSPLAALASSMIAFLVFAGLRFATPLADDHPLILAGLLCFSAAAVIGYAYPSWVWLGVAAWSSLAFWLFLLWAEYLETSIGATPTRPLGEVLTVFLAASSGAWLAGRLRRRRPNQASTDAEAGRGNVG